MSLTAATIVIREILASRPGTRATLIVTDLKTDEVLSLEMVESGAGGEIQRSETLSLNAPSSSLSAIT